MRTDNENNQMLDREEAEQVEAIENWIREIELYDLSEAEKQQFVCGYCCSVPLFPEDDDHCEHSCNCEKAFLEWKFKNIENMEAYGIKEAEYPENMEL